MKFAKFSRVNRETTMPAVSAHGDFRPVIFPFKGNSLPYHTVTAGGAPFVETYASRIPPGAVVTVCVEVHGVDSDNFFECTKLFVAHRSKQNANDCKVLLIYDAYRSQMSLRVLQLFCASGICIYAFPAHKSGKTQPFDFRLFCAFKAVLRDALSVAADFEYL